jgi:hypothetical protein
MIQAQKHEHWSKISPQTAKESENFYDGYPTDFFENNTKRPRIPNDPIKIKFNRFEVVLLFLMN